MSGRDLPTGTLTFLFTDLEGSTRLLHESPDDYGSLLETHRQLIRDAVADCQGVEFGTGGDALFIVFETADAAINCAERAQSALQSYPWPAGRLLNVRMALHTGEARIVDDDYVGLTLHVVARLCSAAHGGQIVVSSTTRALCPNVDVIDLGVHQLRDVAEPMRVFQLCADGLAREFPVLRTLNARPNNLPAPSDRLIGRELEIVEVGAALREHRLVTLTGSGGSGKTRLALEVGGSLVADFADGVWLVQLAAATTPDQVVALTAQELRVAERTGVPLSASLVEHLADRETLLVLDNCEHLIEPVALFVQELLARCPRVRVLATSRELLGLHGEQAIGVAPLNIGDPERPGDAMALFIERASESTSGFGAAEHELATIAEVCQRLDGLPLAIELAAARVRTISLGQLADRLHDRFRLLTGGARSALGRQRTLEAVVAWSYDLLGPAEQRVFRRLSVFPDSFPLEAAEALAADEHSDTVETLGHLVDKSLVVVVPGGTYRYRMLETIRQYGRDRLVEAGEADDAHAELLDWVMTLTARLERDMRTSAQDAAIRAVLPERSNARAALEWAVSRGERVEALRVVSAIPLMATSRRRALLAELLEGVPELHPTRRAQVLLTLANLSFEQGDWESSAEITREAADIFDQLGDERHRAWARYFEIFALWGRPEHESHARQLAAEMVASFRNLNDDFGLAYALWVDSQFIEQPDAAESAAREAEVLFRRLGADFGLAHSLEGRALIALKRGANDEAAAALTEALAIFADADNFGCTAHCLEAIAAALAGDGRLADAAIMVGAAEALRTEVGQEHRVWEREGRTRTEAALSVSADLEGIEKAKAFGHSLRFDDAVQQAQHALARRATADAPASSVDATERI